MDSEISALVLRLLISGNGLNRYRHPRWRSGASAKAVMQRAM
jgi:hypothetical protein